MFEGRPVWVPSTTNNYFYFDVPAFFAFTPGVPVYVRIEYHDAGLRGAAYRFQFRQNPDMHSHRKVRTLEPTRFP